jgi:hypothetical protein
MKDPPLPTIQHSYQVQKHIQSTAAAQCIPEAEHHLIITAFHAYFDVCSNTHIWQGLSCIGASVQAALPSQCCKSY